MHVTETSMVWSSYDQEARFACTCDAQEGARGRGRPKEHDSQTLLSGHFTTCVREADDRQKLEEDS